MFARGHERPPRWPGGCAPCARPARRRCPASRRCTCPPSRSTAPTRRARTSVTPPIAPQERARRVAHALGVGEVAGVVVGDRRRARGRRRRRRAGRGRRGTTLTSTHAPGQALGRVLLGLAGEEQPVLAHARAAPGGVGDDRVDVVGEGVEVAARERAGPGRPRRRASPATPQQPCARRDDRLDAVARQHAQRRPADVRGEHLLRAAGQQRDARAALALARDAPRAAAGRGGQRARAAGAASAARDSGSSARHGRAPVGPAAPPRGSAAGRAGSAGPARGGRGRAARGGGAPRRRRGRGVMSSP